MEPVNPAADPVSILQLEVRLLGISPMVWRRVLLPESASLRELHGVAQVAMGWASTSQAAARPVALAAMVDERGPQARLHDAGMTGEIECRYYGRDFTAEEMALLRALIAADPQPTRAALSREFCRRIGWFKPDGGLKDMMAKVTMPAMHRDGWPLAMLGFSTAAWKLAPRDHFIGWTPQMREKNLPLVVDNPRFFILPWITIPNLGSHILAIVRGRLPQDWAERYNTTPVLIETFVETPRQESSARGCSFARHGT